jgi:hypothetical protein
MPGNERNCAAQALRAGLRTLSGEALEFKSEGFVTGTMVRIFTIALSGDRLRHRSQRGVLAHAGAVGVRGISCFGGGHVAASD